MLILGDSTSQASNLSYPNPDRPLPSLCCFCPHNSPLFSHLDVNFVFFSSQGPFLPLIQSFPFSYLCLTWVFVFLMAASNQALIAHTCMTAPVSWLPELGLSLFPLNLLPHTRFVFSRLPLCSVTSQNFDTSLESYRSRVWSFITGLWHSFLVLLLTTSVKSVGLVLSKHTLGLPTLSAKNSGKQSAHSNMFLRKA